VDGCVGRFEASIRLAADFLQLWPPSDQSRFKFEPFLDFFDALFVDRVLTCLPSESVTPKLNNQFVLRCAQLVPLLAAIGVIRQFEAEALLLFKVPFGSCSHHFKTDHPIL